MPPETLKLKCIVKSIAREVFVDALKAVEWNDVNDCPRMVGGGDVKSDSARSQQCIYES